MDLVVARCTGLHVSKNDVGACVRVPDGAGGQRQEIRTRSSFTFGFEALAGWLNEESVTDVVMEATGYHAVLEPAARAGHVGAVAPNGAAPRTLVTR